MNMKVPAYSDSLDDGCDAFGGNRAPPPMVAADELPLHPFSPPLLAQPHSQMSTPVPPALHQHQQFPHQHRQQALANDIVSPTSSTGSSSSQKSSRRLWSPMEDLVLLTLILTHKHALPAASNAKRFWEFVSQQLRQEHSLHRNTRQCRDRFNLLYARGVRNAACNIEPSSHRDALTLKIAQVFESADRGHYRLSRASEHPHLGTPYHLEYAHNSEQLHHPPHHHHPHPQHPHPQHYDAQQNQYHIPHANAYPKIEPGAPHNLGSPHSVHHDTAELGPTPDFEHLANSVTSLVSTSQTLAMDFQDLSQKFALLSDQVRLIQMRLDSFRGPYGNDPAGSGGSRPRHDQ
ncbi:LAFA_0F18074g1_1 [Lachancea sp. 'fantastica']|nr:LAFA_0F18074g1_1 [Lachancea sp. 'fantastica']